MFSSINFKMCGNKLYTNLILRKKRSLPLFYKHITNFNYLKIFFNKKQLDLANKLTKPKNINVQNHK